MLEVLLGVLGIVGFGIVMAAGAAAIPRVYDIVDRWLDRE